MSGCDHCRNKSLHIKNLEAELEQAKHNNFDRDVYYAICMENAQNKRQIIADLSKDTNMIPKLKLAQSTTTIDNLHGKIQSLKTKIDDITKQNKQNVEKLQKDIEAYKKEVNRQGTIIHKLISENNNLQETRNKNTMKHYSGRSQQNDNTSHYKPAFC